MRIRLKVYWVNKTVLLSAPRGGGVAQNWFLLKALWCHLEAVSKSAVLKENSIKEPIANISREFQLLELSFSVFLHIFECSQTFLFYSALKQRELRLSAHLHRYFPLMKPNDAYSANIFSISCYFGSIGIKHKNIQDGNTQSEHGGNNALFY